MVPLIKKSAYKIACSIVGDLGHDSFSGSWVWKVETLPKIKCFLWQCYHSSIPIRSVLVARGVHLHTSCPICNSASKTIDHLFKECSFAKTFWDSFPYPMQSSLFYGENLVEWLRINCSSTSVYGAMGIT